jgi:hypothetical protein
MVVAVAAAGAVGAAALEAEALTGNFLLLHPHTPSFHCCWCCYPLFETTP